MTVPGDNILEVEGLLKRYGGLTALDRVDFHVRKGEVHAVVGENGAGKSTLMKILGGIVQRDSGQIAFKGRNAEFRSPIEAIRNGIAVIHQELAMLPHLSILENLFMGRMDSAWGHVRWKRLEQRTRVALARVGLDVDPHVPVERLSISQQQLVEIAKALSSDASFIIMDEPNSSLTSTESARLFDLIRQLKRDRLTIVYVSHRLEDVLLISDRITVLRDGKCVGTIAKADATPGKVIQMMVGRELKRFDRPHCARQGESRLSVKGLTGQRFRDVSFSVCPGEILGFAGLVGAGRSEVMRAIFGADRYDSGEVRMDGELVRFRSPKEAVGHGLAIVSEDRKRQSLFMELPIRLNISLVALSRLNRCGVIRRREVDRQVSLFRDRLGIRLRSLEDPVSALSGGNQQKTVLARWLAMAPRVLILDEPTHGIDVGAKAEIYGLMHRLAETGIAILLISSEMPEIIAMSDRVVVMREGRVMGVIPRESLTEDRILAYATGTRPERLA